MVTVSSGIILPGDGMLRLRTWSTFCDLVSVVSFYGIFLHLPDTFTAAFIAGKKLCVVYCIA